MSFGNLMAVTRGRNPLPYPLPPFRSPDDEAPAGIMPGRGPEWRAIEDERRLEVERVRAVLPGARSRTPIPSGGMGQEGPLPSRPVVLTPEEIRQAQRDVALRMKLADLHDFVRRHTEPEPMPPIDIPQVFTREELIEQARRSIEAGVLTPRPDPVATPATRPFLGNAQDNFGGELPADTPVVQDVNKALGLPQYIPSVDYADGIWWLRWEYNF